MKKDFDFQKKWCLAILKYMSSEYSGNKDYQGIRYKDFFQRKINAIQEASDSNRRGMTQAFNDVNQLALSETKNLRKLNEVLELEFGESLFDEQKLLAAVIKRVIKRKRIVSDEEYEIVKEYTNNSVQTDRESVSLLDEMLFAYSKENRG